MGPSPDYEKMDVNRDRTVVEGDKVKRYVWNCPVAEYDRGTGKLTLRTCGYETRLTKNRLNQVLRDKQIQQRDGVWYIGDETFEDGMTIDVGFGGNLLGGKGGYCKGGNGGYSHAKDWKKEKRKEMGQSRQMRANEIADFKHPRGRVERTSEEQRDRG